MPPPVFAVSTTLAPVQNVVAPPATIAAVGALAADNVIVLLVAGLPVTHPSDDVTTTNTWSPFTNVPEYPAVVTVLIPFFFHW